MNLEVIKKELYKQNPIAELGFETDLAKAYSAEIVIEGNEEIIDFIVPFADMGTTVFGETMEAKFLIRWIKK